jgi:radical SAM superfamily enzyme YgiQ (UPF0313 family)
MILMSWCGEGEETVLEVLQAFSTGEDLSTIRGIALRVKVESTEDSSQIVSLTAERPFIKNLDRLPFPARHLLPNKNYIQFGKKKYGYAITSVMSTRGCPYQCDFCSNVIFGGSYRQRSANNVVNEIEDALALLTIAYRLLMMSSPA